MTATAPPGTDVPDHDQTDTRRRTVVIIGSGPAGLTAAIYAARANLEPLVIAGNVPMGQLMITSDVENYPGFPDGIQGPELMQKFRDQATRFGSTILDRDATRVDFSSRPFGIWVGEDEYRADAVIVATGASALWLGLASEEEFRGRGVSACATCDGFFFRGREVAVVGGGDTALEEATFLTRFADKVTMLVRRDEFRGSKIMQDRASRDPKIEILFNKEVTEVRGEMTVNALAAARHGHRRGERAPRCRACSSPSATSRTPSSSPGSSTSVRTATSTWSARPARGWRASSSPATSTTITTARP